MPCGRQVSSPECAAEKAEPSGPYRHCGLTEAGDPRGQGGGGSRGQTLPRTRREEEGSSPHCRPHQSTKRTPSLYYRNSYETAPRKNPHIGEKTTNKATHTDVGLGLPRHAPGGSRPQPRGPSSAPRAQAVRSSGWRPRGSSGATGGSQGAAEGGRPRASPLGPARVPNLVGLRGGAARPDPHPHVLRGPPLRSAPGKLGHRVRPASAEGGAIAPAKSSLSRGDLRPPGPRRGLAPTSNLPTPRGWAGLVGSPLRGPRRLVPAQAPGFSGEVSAFPSRSLAGETGPATLPLAVVGAR